MTPSLPETPITFTVDDEQVVGIWHSANAPFEAAPAVVCCHGFTGHKAECQRLFVQLARALAAHGIGVLRFDFRGSGDSAGEFRDMTVSREVADAQAALAYVQSRPDVDPGYLALLGFSLGGLVAALTAAEHPGLRALVLWNPVGRPARLVERLGAEDLARIEQPDGIVDFGGWAVGAPFFQEMRTLDPLPKVAVPGTTPVLVVTGEADASVPMTEGQTYVEALRAVGREVTAHNVRAAGHTFNTLAHQREAIEVTAVWLSLCLGYRGE